MKKFKILFAFALVLVFAGVFAACEIDTAARAIVSFEDPSGGNTVPDLLVPKGSSMGNKMPTLPPKNGLALHGWFFETTHYDRDTIITEDITLTARWADDVAIIKFEFTQTDASGKVIQPTFPVFDVAAIRGVTLGPLEPVTPRAKGWQFDTWLLPDGTEFTKESLVPGSVTMSARWVAKKALTVKFYPGPGVAAIPDMTVYENECIDEWEKRFPQAPTVNPVDPSAFFVAWLDDENREYDGRTVVTRSLQIDGRWGMPPYIVKLRMAADGGDIDEVQNHDGTSEGTTSFNARVRQSWDGKWVIVNDTTYDIPNNTNRWKILYRVKFKWPSNFSTGFYTRYTIRARFYANRQGSKTWVAGGDPDFKEGQFIPNKPAEGKGYNRDGWLVNNKYQPNPDADNPDYSRSEDSWGQISWTIKPNWNGQGADAETLIQRYNIDRKGGTINDTWAPMRGSVEEKEQPPYLLVQTSDSYIGHIEITEIVFHNGEWEHTAYEGEPKPPPPPDPEN